MCVRVLHVCASLARRLTVLLTTRNSLTRIGAEPRPSSGLLQRLCGASGGRKGEVRPLSLTATISDACTQISDVKMTIPQCKNAPLQVDSAFKKPNVLKVSKTKVLVLQKNGSCECYVIIYDIYILTHQCIHFTVVYYKLL